MNRIPWTYAARRLLASLPICVGVSLFTFLLIRLIPGDPAVVMLGEHASDPAALQQMREEMGLNHPVPIQYGMFLVKAVQGDLGRSLRTEKPVMEDMLAHFPATLELALGGMVFALLIGLCSGTLAGFSRSRVVDTVSMVLALIGVSVPIFWLGLQLISWFSVALPWFPISGRTNTLISAEQPAVRTGMLTLDSILAGRFDSLMDALRHLVLPSVTLGLIMSAMIARMTRSSIRDVLEQPYIHAARARGISGRRLFHHAFSNALIPVITVIGLQLGALLSGAVITESIFAWPGMGTYLVESISSRDYPAVQGAVLALAILFVLTNLTVDIVCAVADPRVRMSVQDT